jgi:hypothetical protein
MKRDTPLQRRPPAALSHRSRHVEDHQGQSTLEERMTAIVLPDIDFEELRKNVPSLSEIELPSLARAGKNADEVIDRWRGRPRGPSWPWIAAGIFVIGLIGTLAALMTWSRREPMLEDLEIPSAPLGGIETYPATEPYTGTESMPA